MLEELVDSSDDVYVTGGGAPNTAVQKFLSMGFDRIRG